MVIAVLVLASASVGMLVASVVSHWPAADPARSASDSLARKVREVGHLRSFLHDRFDPETVTGLALTAASVCIVAGGIVVGVLAYVVRENSGPIYVDSRVAHWAATHATSVSTGVLRGLTQLGSTPVVVSVSLAVGLIEYRRIRSRSLWLFLVLAVGGELLVVNLIKLGVARSRPAIDPLASFSGSSFPSGHTAAAAACYAALALILARGRAPRIRAVLTGGAAAIAVAVGCSRMLLGVHWFTDVLAGLALGWAWLALCAIATGGRLLEFGAPAKSTRPPQAEVVEGSRHPSSATTGEV